MKSEEMISYFNDCRRKESMNQMLENSFLEEGVYLRTRKRTLEDLLNQTEASSSSSNQAAASSSNQVAAATISSNNSQAAATTISSISSSDQAAATTIISSSNPDDTADIYNGKQDKRGPIMHIQYWTSLSFIDISFLSNTTDDTDFTNNTSEPENIYYKSYILCYDELTKSAAKKIARDQVEKYDAHLFGFEDIL